MPRNNKSAGDLDAMLRLIEERAPKLIAAGVTSLAVDGLSLTLASRVPGNATEIEMPTVVAPTHIDPLRDASTYPGGRVPGFTREGELPE